MFELLKRNSSRVENPCVGGSIPPRATKTTFGWFFLWVCLKVVDGVITLVPAPQSFQEFKT